MQIVLFLILGIGIGVLVGWLWARSRETGILQQLLRTEGQQKAAAQAELRQTRTSLDELGSVRSQLSNESQRRVAAETKLKEAEANLEQQRRLLEEATVKLTDAFGALSAEALKSNNQAFLALAKSTFETMHAQAKGDLVAQQSAIDGLLSPLKEALSRYEKQASEMEKSRQSAYGSLEEQLRNLSSTSQLLQRETGSLVTALRSPQVRGRWGEMTLKRAAELAGMSDYCDFDEQASLWNEAGKQQRPDMVVKLPGGRRIIVDAKVPLQAFLDAAEQDHTLVEDAMERKVVIATPTTLIALLRAIAYGWRQERMTENAQAIGDLGKQLYDRIKIFVGRFGEVGGALTKTVDAYNKAAGSLESRVLPSARRFKELGAAPGEEIVEIDSVDESPRTLAFPEKNES